MPHITHAGNTLTVTRGPQATTQYLWWNVVGGGGSCNGVYSGTPYPATISGSPNPDGIAADWAGGHSLVNSMSFTSVITNAPSYPATYVFRCVHASDPSKYDDATLIVNDCTLPQVWSTASNSCVPGYTLTVSPQPANGTVTSVPAGITCGASGTDCTELYPSGQSVTLTANPSGGGYVVGTWGGACSGNAATCVVSMTAARTVSVTFVSSSCPSPWGGPAIPNGSSTLAYLSPSVPAPGPCSSQTRTCTNGVLSGTYTNQTCSVTGAPVVTVTPNTASGGTTGSARYAEAGPSAYIQWSATNGATSCTVYRNGVVVPGATYAYPGTTQYPIPAPGLTALSTQYRVDCTNGTVGTGNTVTFTVPPPQTTPGHVCSADATSVTTTWTMPVGYNMHYVRLRDNAISSTTFINNGTGSSYTFTGLIPGRSYNWWGHTRIANGNYSASIGEAFTCVAAALPPPTVVTNPATAVTTSQATLNSTVNPNGFSTNVTYRYGTSNVACASLPSTISGGSAGAGTSNVPNSVTVSSLAANTTYYYCATATNANGTMNGNVQSFTTSSSPPPQPPAPTVSTSGTCGGVVNVSWGGVAGATSYDLQYKLSSGSTWTSLTNVTSPRTVSGLTPGAAYDFQLLARNAAGPSPWSAYGQGNSSAACAAPVNGVCGTSNGGSFSSTPATNLCSVGSPSWTDSTGSDGTYNWSCSGSNGGTNASCSANRVGGTISVTTCDIPANASTCPVTVTWSSTNLSSPNVVAGATLVAGSSGVSTNLTGVPHTVTYGNTIFSLRDGGTTITAVSVTINCVPGYTWAAGSCVSSTVPPTLTIVQGGNPVTLVNANTQVSVQWDTNNLNEGACSLTGGGLNYSSSSGGLPAGGTQVPGSEAETGSVNNVTIGARTTFVLTCPGGTVTKTVDIIPQGWET